MDNKMYPEHVTPHLFSEHPVKNYLAEGYTEYDIIGKYVGTVDFVNKGEFSNRQYCQALVLKLIDLSKSQVRDFIEYQLKLMTDEKHWLFDLEKLLELNANHTNYYKPDLINSIASIISERLKANSQVRTSQQQLKWNGSDTDLLELIVALTQSNTVVNIKGESVRTEVIAVFEDLFNRPITNPENTLQRAAARTRDKAPFLRKLTSTFEIWATKGNKS